MTKLVSNVRERLALLYQGGRKRVSKIVDADVTELGLRERWLKDPTPQIVTIEWFAFAVRKHPRPEFLLSGLELGRLGRDEPFLESLGQLRGHINAPTIGVFRSRELARHEVAAHVKETALEVAVELVPIARTSSE